MVKRILLSIVMLMLIAYLGIAITAFNRKPADQTCRDVELVIKDTTYAGFITKEEVKGILQHKGIYPIGKKDGAHLYQVAGTGTEQASADRRSGMLQNTQRQSLRRSDTTYTDITHHECQRRELLP